MSRSNCCDQPKVEVTCKEVITCVNTELGKVVNSVTNKLTSFCPAVVVCVDAYLRTLPGYSDTIDKVLSTTGGEIGWQEPDFADITTADMGLSITGNSVRLGQSIGALLDPAALTEDREIPFGDFSLAFTNATAAGSPTPIAGSFTFSIPTLLSGGINYGAPGYITHTSAFSGNNHMFDVPATSTIRNFGNNSYYGTTTVIGDRYLGVQGYHYQDFGGGANFNHFFIFDMSGSDTSYVAIETDAGHFGNSHCNWIYDGSTHFGLAGNQKTIFGAAVVAASINGFVHIIGSTSSTPSFFLQGSAVTPSAPVNGAIWHNSSTAHLFARLGGVTKQIDHTSGVSGALSAGSVTVNTSDVTSSSNIQLTHATSSGTLGILSVGTIVDGVSFVINSSDAGDTSLVNWLITN